MQGWQIFKHAFMMVVRNIIPALQIFLLPNAILIGGVFALVLLNPDLQNTLFSGEEVEFTTAPPSGFFSTLLLGLVGYVFVQIWTIVAWHRFVLLEEYPQGWLPPLSLDRMGAYFLRAFIIFAILAAASLIFVFALIFTGPLAAVIALPAMVFAWIVFMRWSITLPAAAVAQNITLGEAWDATRESTGLFLGLLFSLLLFGLLVALVGFVFEQIPVLGVFWNIPTQILLTVINISVITTLYGVFVEKRELG